MLNKFHGCLIIKANGDVLGYHLEFIHKKEIFEKYIKNGITEYQLRNVKAIISDDTQMTLFTVNGIIFNKKYNKNLYKLLVKAIYLAKKFIR